MLRVDWYLEQPLDFEYKNYILLDYIQSVDSSYKIHKLSPYLLWTEKLVSELKDFETKRKLFLKKIEKDVILYEDYKIKLIKQSLEEPEFIKTIKDIVDYSTPLLESKIKLGYTLLNKYPQILF